MDDHEQLMVVVAAAAVTTATATVTPCWPPLWLSSPTAFVTHFSMAILVINVVQRTSPPLCQLSVIPVSDFVLSAYSEDMKRLALAVE
jgi:hypothetical protein